MKSVKRKCAAFLMCSIFVALCTNYASAQEESDKETLLVMAKVVAYSPFSKLVVTVGRSKTYFMDDLLIRIEKTNGELKKGEFIRVRYDHKQETARLPEEIYKKELVFEFELTREVSLDENLRELFYSEHKGKTQEHLRRTPWAVKIELPLEKTIIGFEAVSVRKVKE